MKPTFILGDRTTPNTSVSSPANHPQQQQPSKTASGNNNDTWVLSKSQLEELKRKLLGVRHYNRPTSNLSGLVSNANNSNNNMHPTATASTLLHRHVTGTMNSSNSSICSPSSFASHDSTFTESSNLTQFDEDANSYFQKSSAGQLVRSGSQVSLLSKLIGNTHSNTNSPSVISSATTESDAGFSDSDTFHDSDTASSGSVNSSSLTTTTKKNTIEKSVKGIHLSHPSWRVCNQTRSRSQSDVTHSNHSRNSNWVDIHSRMIW